MQLNSTGSDHVHWPSGSGIEFGVVDLPISMIAERARRRIFEDDGILAVVLDPGPVMPVTFVLEPSISDDLVAIIADQDVDIDRLRERVSAIVAGGLVRWHDLSSALRDG